jgi:Fungal N-terminal domain of STAND proteins
MPVGFGFSAGDFIAALELVGTVIDALRDSGSASAEYRELLRVLYSLETVLIQVKRLEVHESQRAELISLRQAAAQCQQTIDDFLSKIKKYQPHLCSSTMDSNFRMRTAWAKIKWAVCRRDDLATFKIDLIGHMESINILLAVIQMYDLPCMATAFTDPYHKAIDQPKGQGAG